MARPADPASPRVPEAEAREAAQEAVMEARAAPCVHETASAEVQAVSQKQEARRRAQAKLAEPMPAAEVEVQARPIAAFLPQDRSQAY